MKTPNIYAMNFSVRASLSILLAGINLLDSGRIKNFMHSTEHVLLVL